MTTSPSAPSSPRVPAATAAATDIATDIAIDTTGMSEGKKRALEQSETARDAVELPSFAAGLFVGRFDWGMISPFPAQSAADRTAGQEFITKLEAFAKANIDGDDIDRDGVIPPFVIDGLREIGALGIKIPKEYGGLGLHQVDYTRAAMLLGSICASTTALVSAHQSIGVPTPIKLFGTKEQKDRFLPRCARGELTGFALTEEDAGSDPARLHTHAAPTADGKGYVINGRKLWCTNGSRAKMLVIVAKTPPVEVGGRKRDQISAFVVEADSPGLKIAHVSQFMGHRAMANVIITLENVFVPKENLIWGEGRGLKIALTTLNTGRLTLPAAAVGVTKRCLAIVRRWAASREQWGGPIGHHAAIADKIGRMAADVFAMEAMTLLTSGLVDRGDADIRLEAAMCKMWGTETTWRIVNDTLQIRGGRGYETAESLAQRGEAAIPVERFVRDARITTVFEGSSEILRLFLAREALDPHLRVAGGALDKRLPMGKRLGVAMKAGLHYATKYPMWLLPAGAPAGVPPQLAGHLAYAARTSRRLTRALLHAMARHSTALEGEQVLLGRLMDVGAEVFAIASACAYAQHLALGDAKDGADAIVLADHFCREARVRIDRSFRGISHNEDASLRALSVEVLAGRFTLLERDLPVI
ncbi:MAG: acyl-CoA dehydrogenase family protein [Planctomycetes bacterium]|nr:acyl-CoA dehydrogenase family protein [Planctomycetota bacterium]